MQSILVAYTKNRNIHVPTQENSLYNTVPCIVTCQLSWSLNWRHFLIAVQSTVSHRVLFTYHTHYYGMVFNTWILILIFIIFRIYILLRSITYQVYLLFGWIWCVWGLLFALNTFLVNFVSFDLITAVMSNLMNNSF